MTLALHAHDLDPSRATGIARYARGLVPAVRSIAPELDAVAVTALGSGDLSEGHVEIPLRRRDLNARWLATRRPLIESLLPDVALVHATAPIVPLPTRKPLVVTVHDVMPLTNPTWFARAPRFYFRRCVPWIEERVDAIIVPTEFVARQVHDLLHVRRAPIIVTGEGVDAGWLRPDPTGEVLARHGLDAGGYLLHLGAVSNRKNLEPVLAAIRGTDDVLALAGPPGIGSEVARAAASELDGRVRLLGRVDDSDVGPLVRGARALVHPSLFEGFGLTVLEAMAVGTPVVCSDAGALTEVAGDGAIIVTGGTPATWRDALRQLEAPGARDALRVSGRRVADRWTWDGAAAKTVEVYRSLL